MTGPEPDADVVAPGQATLFGDDDDFKLAYQLWRGMPDYSNEDLLPWKVLAVNFESLADYEEFKRIVDQPKMTIRTRSIWFPRQEWEMVHGFKRWISREP